MVATKKLYFLQLIVDTQYPPVMHWDELPWPISQRPPAFNTVLIVRNRITRSSQVLKCLR